MKVAELHIISNGKQRREHLAEIICRIHREVDFIHLREKNRTATELIELVQLLTDNHVPLSKIIINDRVDVAVASKAKGVQLAHHSLSVEAVTQNFSGLSVGCSVHTIKEAQLAEEKDADYVLFGHVFATLSKPGLMPRGVALLKAVSESISIPAIAIGGITPENTTDVINAGAQGIAVMSGIFEAKDPLQAARQYRANLAR